MRESHNDAKKMGVYFTLAQVGMEMVVPVGVGVALDMKFEWAPWGTIVGAVLGLIVGITHLISLLGQQNQGKNQPKRDAS